ncbi:MAG: ABC transporter permease [Deinococcales bacterium]
MRKIPLLNYLPLLLGILVLMAYYLLPFVNQPDLGPSPINLLTEKRANNEFGLVTNGLILLPVAGVIMLLLGLWNLLNPQLSRGSAIFSALAGLLMLEYFVIFTRDYLSEGASYLPNMSSGFWALVILSFLAIFQAFLPRARVSEEFQLKNLLGNQESAILIAIVALLLIIGISSPRFLATRNILDILQGNAYIAVAAIGMSMVIITGNIDISVGSLVGLLAVFSGRLVVGGLPPILAWLLPLLIGALVGAFIGYLVAYLRVPSIVVTLGMLSILKGLLILWTGGQRVTGMPDSYYLAQMKPLGIPMPVIFMIVLTILAALWMRYSARGRALYAVGGNPDAARLSGLSTKGIIMQAFILNGIFAAIASVLYATQLQVIQATPPPNLELFIITSSVVGGVSILGGTGTVIGAMLAAILLNMIRSGMIFINISPFWIQAVQGVLILVTVLIDLLRRRQLRH